MSKWESLCTVMFDETLVDIGERYDLIEAYETPISILNFLFMQRFAEELGFVLSRYRSWYHLLILDSKGDPDSCFLFSTLGDLHEYLLKKQREQIKKALSTKLSNHSKTPISTKLTPIKKKTRRRKKNGRFCPHKED